jgi:glutathione S-transferase
MAGGDELKLLGSWLSPFATRVKLALTLKGLSYAEVEEDLCNKSELLLSSNPVHKKVPVLIHNGAPVCESVIIMQYIDEAFAGVGPSLLPSDPHERAAARFWASYIDDKLVIPWVRSFRGKTEEEKSEGLKQTFSAVETLEGALRECSKGKKGGFFGGDGVGLVDVTLGSLLTWAHAAEVMSGTKIFDPARTPLLAAWTMRFDELDAAMAVMPDVGRMVEFKTKQARALAAAGASDSK